MKTCLILAKFDGLPKGTGMWYSIDREDAEKFVLTLGNKFILRIDIEETDPIVGKL